VLEEGLAEAVAEKTVSADANESGGQDVLQKRLAEGQHAQLGGLDAVSVFAIAVLKADSLAVVAEQTLVADGDLAQVTGEVSDHLLGTAEGSADVDVPSGSRSIAETLVAGLVGNARLSFTQKRPELREELSLEDRLEDDEGDKVTTAVDEALWAKPTAGDETVNVRVVAELLVPGVEHGEDAGDDTERGRRLEDRLGDGGEKRVQGMTPVLSAEEAPKRDGDREDHVEVRDRQQVRDLGLGPQTLVETTAARAVTVAAGVVGVVLGSTAVADRTMATQAAGAASQDVGNRLALLVVEAQTTHRVAEDVRDREHPLEARHATT
jgi:hypothetical protein